jgi:hypothetical protein
MDSDIEALQQLIDQKNRWLVSLACISASLSLKYISLSN